MAAGHQDVNERRSADRDRVLKHRLSMYQRRLMPSRAAGG